MKNLIKIDNVFFCILICFILSLIIASCSSTNSSLNSSAQPSISNPSQSTQKSEVSRDAPRPTSYKPEVSTDDVLSQNAQLVKDTVIDLIGGYTPDDVRKKLGEPDKTDNINRIPRWFYKQGLEIDFQSQNDILFLFNYIYLDSSSTVKTGRNIGIGSPRGDVLKAYKNEIEAKNISDKVIVAGERGMGIIFQMENDKVVTIYIATGAYTLPPARDIPEIQE